MADVHHHDQALERLAGAEILVEERLPVHLQVVRHLGVAVAGEVDQIAVGLDLEEHQLLGAAGVLDTRAREFCRVKALSALDLPALERPAKATS